MQQLATIVPLAGLQLSADVSLPDRAKGLVLFAHGSGSSRHSSRNRHVAEVLNRGSIGTVLIDLLTEEEEAVDVRTAELRFDIPLLGRRVAAITDWIGRQPHLKNLGLGVLRGQHGRGRGLGRGG
jgi:putative phosphoribosyl transferase